MLSTSPISVFFIERFFVFVYLVQQKLVVLTACPPIKSGKGSHESKPTVPLLRT